MSAAPLLIVRGEVSREVQPDHARVDAAVTVRHQARQAVLSELTARADALGRLLDSYTGGIERTETTSLSVQPARTVSGERTEGYDGYLQVQIVVTDFSVLGELMLRLGGRDGMTVQGPWWGLRPGGNTQRQARQDAITEAFTRAREYAEAVGARLVRLVQLADADGGGGAVPLAMGAYELADGVQMRLDPRPQTVFASVEARFEITDPPL